MLNSADIVILAIVIGYAACCLADRALDAYRMKLRARNIAAAGWPPAHLNADGEQIEQDE